MPIQRFGLIVTGILVERKEAMRDRGWGPIQSKQREGRTAPVLWEAKDRETLMFRLCAVFVEQDGRMRVPGRRGLIPEQSQRADAHHTDVAFVPLPVMLDIHDRQKDIPHPLCCFSMPPEKEGVPVTRFGSSSRRYR